VNAQMTTGGERLPVDRVTDTQRALGRALRRRATACGMSPRELALQAGVSHPAVLRLLSGRGHVTIRTIELVCVVLEITVTEALLEDAAQPGRGL
jgi:transcriptional regulator with XRE-family HTH domain